MTSTGLRDADCIPPHPQRERLPLRYRAIRAGVWALIGALVLLVVFLALGAAGWLLLQLLATR